MYNTLYFYQSSTNASYQRIYQIYKFGIDPNSDYILSCKSAIPGTIVTPRVNFTVSSISTTFFNTYFFPHVTETFLELAAFCDPFIICSDNAGGFLAEFVPVCKSFVCETSNKVCDTCITTHLYCFEFYFTLLCE